MPPKTVSHFELREKLGEGGMGEVYKAWDLKAERMVALKFPSAALVRSYAERERFRQEGLALSKLSHPHVATVYEVDELDGAPFLALEYLAGGTVRARIEAAGGRIPASFVVKWAIELAEGLDHAHRHGIIHRDVKSSNAMFDSEGRAKLTDFGLARSRNADEQVTPGRIEGTIGYLAPEQLQGEPASPQGDLFAFGVLLFEMATGQLPFWGKSSKEIIGKVQSEAPPRLSSLRSDLPPGLETVIRRLLEKKPENRYPTAHLAAQALRALRVPSPDSVQTEPLVLPQPAQVVDRRWLILLGTALVGGFGWMNIDRIRRWGALRGLPDIKHVAILPFRSIGGDAGQQAFCDGMTETLTTSLGKQGSFSVVPATESRKLASAGDARREFGVNLVIASTVQRRGDQLRVIINLIDAVTMRQLDAETIDWPLARLHEMEDSVIAKISNLLRVTGVEAANPMMAGASQLPSAVDAYFRGRGYLYRWDKAGNYDRALEQFELAKRLDPKFALAPLGLAETQLGLYVQRRDASRLDSAREAAGEAVRLNPQLAGGHIALGSVFFEMGDMEKVKAELDRALKLDPREPAAYRGMARLLTTQKRYKEAEEIYRRAIAMRPGDWGGYSALGFFYLSRQRYPEALEQLQKVTELTPDNHYGYRNLGSALYVAGHDPKEAEAMFRKAISLNPTGRSYTNLGAVLMYQERYREAVPVMEQAAQFAREEGAGDFKAFGNLGDAYQLAGEDKEKAARAWREALEIVEKRRRAKPGDAELLAMQGVYRAKLGEKNAAFQDAASAVQMAADAAPIHYLAALSYAVSGADEKAVGELRTAARLGYSRDSIRRAPEFSRLRSLPAFEQILNTSASQKQ